MVFVSIDLIAHRFLLPAGACCAISLAARKARLRRLLLLPLPVLIAERVCVCVRSVDYAAIVAHLRMLNAIVASRTCAVAFASPT